jgi:hypothetical protein
MILVLAGLGLFRPGATVAAHRWKVRSVEGSDGAQLRALMQGCVSDERAFWGACQPLEWTDTWAEYVIAERPDSVVVSFGEAVAAYVDVPRRKAFQEDGFTPYRNAFWCGAAGVRSDLDPDTALTVFRHAVWEALRTARANGYERVRCAAPWLRHPAFAREFAAYPGLTVEPFFDEQDRRRYLIDWELDSALAALEGEGASVDLNDAIG